MEKNNLIPEDFVKVSEYIPQVIEYLRYATTENFKGEKIDGYAKTEGAIMTKKSLVALKKVHERLWKDGYNLVIYDTYRPQRAVDHFMRWAQESVSTTKKESYYPTISKIQLFEEDYVAAKSGHSRGSTLDVGLIEKDKTLQEIKIITRKYEDGREYNYLDDGTLDMGTHWDFMDKGSHYENNLLPQEIKDRRQYLRNIFLEEGFTDTDNEWWHFRYLDEPYPNTFFDFILE